MGRCKVDSTTREIIAIYLKTIVEQEQFSAIARQYVNGDISIGDAVDAVYAIVDGEGGA